MIARENPFAPARLERLLGFDPELSGTTWEELESHWADHDFRGAITGEQGSGKTSLLNAWGRRLEARGESPLRLFFNEQRRRLRDTDREILVECEGRILLIDGEQHLPWLERRQVWKAAAKASGVIVARWHRGPWSEILRLEASPRLAAALLERAAPAYSARFQPDLEARFRRCRGNLRELWLGLYDEIAR